MRLHYLFLLVYLLGCCCGASNAQIDATCAQDSCGQVPDPTTNFFQCVGLPSTDTGQDHMRRLKGMLEATMDVYTFLRSKARGVPLLTIQGELDINPGVDPLQNEDLVHMWLEVSIKPLLKSITKGFLTCLSTKNFSCSTYQTVVTELSNYYSEMDPVRQKWIYTFFMYPFLSGDGVAGCVNPQEDSEEWLMNNFGAFRVEARIQDFLNLNLNFSGLEVLHLLSGAQKAELLLMPDPAGLDNASLAFVFDSLLTGNSAPTMSPEGSNNWTTPSGLTQSSYDPYLPPSPQNSFREVVNGFMTTFRPIGSFVHDFVSFTQTRNVSEIRSITLTQFLLNWTLAELADKYQPQNTSPVPTFDVTSVEDWYQQVVMPALMRFMPNEAALMHQNIKLAFEKVYYMDYGNNNGTSEIEDVCSITLDKSPCGLTDAVENLASVFNCAARSNLTMSEATVLRLITKLTKRMNSLIEELYTQNVTEMASNFQQIFGEFNSPSLTEQHMEDPNFIKMWFQIKLMPLLPNVSPDLLSCLSTKNFSCTVYQTIVAALSEQMSSMGADEVYSQNIYDNFIYSFLLQHDTSDFQCFTSANQSAEWLINNFGFFSTFASITDFYELNPNFSGLEVLYLLSPKQIAEMLLLPLPAPPGKDVVIRQVFDFLLMYPEPLPDVLYFLVQLAGEVNPPCSIYEQIFEALYGTILYLPPTMEPVVWTGINDLIYVAPAECVPQNVMCPTILYNATSICAGVDSSELQFYLNTYTDVPCNFPLENYACAQLENFTANQLVSLLECDLPENSSHSEVLWKMLLSKLSRVLDPALDILSDMPVIMVGPSAMEVLDVISDMRLSFLTEEQLKNSSVIQKWFSGRLSGLLPNASASFLTCLSHRNLSCQSYQQILKVFTLHFGDMTITQQKVVFKDFILGFLLQPNSDPGCVNGSADSAGWLSDNLGPFSMFMSLRDVLNLNPLFNPLEALELLTPEQTAELLVLTDPALPDRDVIINTVFDFLTQQPDETGFSDFLVYLVMFLPQGNLSCSSYKTLYTRLDLAMATVPLNLVSSIAAIKINISQYIPPDCSIYGGQCNSIKTNETTVCAGVNSTTLQLYLDSGMLNGQFCDFSVEQFACASLSALSADDLAAVMMCNRSSNSSGSRPAWKLFLTKASPVLDEALDLLSNQIQILDPRNPAVSVILDTLQELQLNTASIANLDDPAFINLWFNVRLRPFLPAVSPNFLSCLAKSDFNCSTYQLIIRTLNGAQADMTLSTQVLVYTHFIKLFLTRNYTIDPSCSFDTVNSADWMQTDLGGFSAIVPFQDLQILYPQFSPMDVLPQLSPRQLAALSATPGLLTSPDQANVVMSLIPNKLLPGFYDDLSSAIVGHENTLPSPVRTAFLQVVFDRVNLSDSSVSDSVVSQWLSNRLPPLLVNLSSLQVAPFFGILAGRSCAIGQQGVQDLNSVIPSLSDNTKTEIYNNIVQSLGGPEPLRCYGNSYNTSFYSYLELSFMGFQFPSLTTFLSLMPQDRMNQLVNSMSLSDLGEFLNRPGVVDDSTQLCVLYSMYSQTPVFLQTVSLPVAVEELTLPCVWPMALSSSTSSEVDVWFDQSLRNYLVYLTKNLISPEFTHNASCLAFQKFVSVLGGYNYTFADFTPIDVYNSINDYLSLPPSDLPRCYDANNPDLNSTAWFVEYIGPFMSFLTLDDFQTFGSAEVLQVFTVNLLNIALLNQSAVPLNLTDYYTELVYQEDPYFNPLLLPLLCRCVAPGAAFSQLTAEESMIILQNLSTVCTNIDPQIAAALAGNLGNSIDATELAALGNESTGLSAGQIKTINPLNLYNALSTLSNVVGWDFSQASAIIQALMSSGLIQIAGSSSLFMLGSLVEGVPAKTFSSISGSQLISASANPTFLANLMSGPQIIQENFVSQIVSVNTNSDVIIQNVPDQMATQIPRDLLLGFSSNDAITTINRKKWKQEQVVLFFDGIATENATAVLGSPDNFSSSVLQGFTCTGVRAIQTTQINKLIKACRRSDNNRVQLVETQLTCMYNYIKGNPDVTSFTLYPPDVMLYYDYSLVPQAVCRSYFQQLANANFSVFSSVLSYKRNNLFANARSCLGITNTSLTKDNILVMGNMCCTLDGSYIQNSDPYILETLKNCPDLTDAQAAAVQTLLLSGNTQYGAPSTWNQQTLTNLGILPLYLTSTFYKNFDQKTKQSFLKYFLKLINSNGVSQEKKRTLMQQITLSLISRSKRTAVSNCTVGVITQVTISDDTFPFNYYDINQFNSCLSATTVKDNLEAITQKVTQLDYLSIVLSKLQEAYGASTIIPEDQVQVLGPASRVATIDNINKWNITQIDTLAALMSSTYGSWDPSLANVIILKYLRYPGNTLGSSELNAIGGVNLCALGVDVLKNISQQSLKGANALNVTNCTSEKLSILFNIAVQAFTSSTRAASSVSSYQLAQAYLGGATSVYVQSLVGSNVNMDLATFTSLPSGVVMNLTVSQVKSLLGSNLPDLKSYENQTLVQTWIRSQYQSQLDTLGLGLVGGLASTDTTTTTTTTASTANTATTTTTTSSTTKGHGTRMRADAGLSFLAFLALFIISQHIVG